MEKGRLSRVQVPQLNMACKDSGSLPNWAQGLGREETTWLFWR